MLRAGLALDNALRVLIDMSHKPSMATLLQGVLDAVKGGTPLSRALAQHRDLFGDFYINMIRSGEASGQMSAVLERLVAHMERQRALRDSVISATIYPAILLGVAVLSLIAMLGFVVPQFEKLFTDMGDALPLPTQMVMALGHAFTRYGLLIGIAALGLGLLVRRWVTSPAGRMWWQSRLLKMPLMGPLAPQVPTDTVLPLPGHAARQRSTDAHGPAHRHRDGEQHRAPAVALQGGSHREGGWQGGAGHHRHRHLRAHRDQPDPRGEETGRIGQMMLELSNILNREVETGIKRLLTLVEPVLILVLGVLIAAIIVSILLGILSINDLAV